MMPEGQEPSQEVVLRAVGSHGRVLNKGQQSHSCGSERALWLPWIGVKGDGPGAGSPQRGGPREDPWRTPENAP